MRCNIYKSQLLGNYSRNNKCGLTGDWSKLRKVKLHYVKVITMG
jgi:hypothetical protein